MLGFRMGVGFTPPVRRHHTTLRLKPGLHEYKFVVNGDNWQPDPENPDVSGPYSNSVVRVEVDN
jgi:hypothetical protein